MKKYILAFSALAISTSFLMAQEKTGGDYLKLAKKQKIIGIGLMVGGAGTVWLGTTLETKAKNSSFDLSNVGDHAVMKTGVIFLGAGLMVLGIKLLVQSGKNKKRGASLSFKNEIIQKIKNSSLVHTPMPAVSIRINL